MLNVVIRKQLPNFQLDIQFTVRKSVLVLFGPSGSGKTTILKCIAGLTKPDDGEIILDHFFLFSKQFKVDLPPQRRGAGFVFQDYALFPHQNVKQNILYGAKKNDRNQILDYSELIELLEISQLQSRYPLALSGGEKQRVALARALMANPKMLLFDEPLAALDNNIRLKLQDKLLEIQKRFEIPLILVTHDLQEAKKMGNKIVYIKNGRQDSMISNNVLIQN